MVVSSFRIRASPPPPPPPSLPSGPTYLPRVNGYGAYTEWRQRLPKIFSPVWDPRE